MSKLAVQELDRAEKKHIAELKRAPALTRIKKLSDEKVKEILVERNALVVLYFGPFLDTAIQSLYNAPDSARQAVEWLAEDEFRPYSHRTAAMEDMTRIGMPVEDIIGYSVSDYTEAVARDLVEIVQYDQNYSQEENWVRTLACVRAAETSAGIEFDILADEIERRFGLKRDEQVYFAPHADHDVAKKTMGESDKSHAGRIGMEIARLLTPDVLPQAKESLEEMFRERWSFYGQFIE